MANNDGPLVTIITPSFNQGKFIQETIESVLSQDYSQIEHIVVDGGSSDETLNILMDFKEKDPRFQFISEPDNGQSHALNKGLSIANGEIIGWLNSDDTYLPKAINHAIQTFKQKPNCSMVYGNANIIDENNELIMPYTARKVRLKNLFNSCPFCQPAVFLRKKTLNELGGIDESLDFCMDYDLWIRIAKSGYSMSFVNATLANSRYYSDSKTGSKFADVGFPEIIRTSKRHFGTVSPVWLNFFLHYFRKKGVCWFINIFKSFAILKDTPIIINSDLANTSASKQYDATIQSFPGKPLHAIVLEGTQDKFDKLPLKIFINDQLFRQIDLSKGPFVKVIPVSTNHLLTRLSFIPDELNIDHLKIASILPLSKEEEDFMKAFEKGTEEVKRWIIRNIK